MTYLTVSLDATHKKRDFNCGKLMLDNYLQTQAKQDVKKKLAACFVLADETGIIKGYYTLSSASIKRDLLPDTIIRKLPPSYGDLPVTLLGRLAIDSFFKGQGLGEVILLDALKRCYYAALKIGSIAVVVAPLDEDAERFYLKYGFISLPDSGKMFIPMDIVAALFP